MFRFRYSLREYFRPSRRVAYFCIAAWKLYPYCSLVYDHRLGEAHRYCATRAIQILQGSRVAGNNEKCIFRSRELQPLPEFERSNRKRPLHEWNGLYPRCVAAFMSLGTGLPSFEALRRDSDPSPSGFVRVALVRERSFLAPFSYRSPQGQLTGVNHSGCRSLAHRVLQSCSQSFDRLLSVTYRLGRDKTF
jgi:hypothetical protein